MRLSWTLDGLFGLSLYCFLGLRAIGRRNDNTKKCLGLQTPYKPHGLYGQTGPGAYLVGSMRYPQLSYVRCSRARIHGSS